MAMCKANGFREGLPPGGPVKIQMKKKVREPLRFEERRIQLAALRDKDAVSWGWGKEEEGSRVRSER